MWSVLRGLPVRQLMIIINLNSHHQFTNEVVYSFPRAIACFRKANSLRKTHILLQGSYISVPWSLKVMPWAGVPRCWAESTLGAQSSRECLLLSNGLWCCAWPSPQNHTHAQQPQSCCRGGVCLPRVSVQCVILPISFIQMLWKPKETHSKWPSFPEGSASLQVLRDGAVCQQPDCLFAISQCEKTEITQQHCNEHVHVASWCDSLQLKCIILQNNKRTETHLRYWKWLISVLQRTVEPPDLWQTIDPTRCTALLGFCCLDIHQHLCISYYITEQPGVLEYYYYYFILFFPHENAQTLVVDTWHNCPINHGAPRPAAPQTHSSGSTNACNVSAPPSGPL